MRQIQFYGAVSLDGYLATPADDIRWLTDLPNLPEVDSTVLGQMTAGIMGRVTYDVIQQLAPGEPLNPANPTMQSYVLTHQSRANQPGVTFTSENVVTLAQRLQRETTGNVWVVGGSQILMPLLAADLIDDLYLQVAPVLLGAGKRLFGPLVHPQQFSLTTVHQYGPLAELIYHRTN